jgi:hypothetical protein
VTADGALERRYRLLLSCYPRAHRAEYGDEMLGVLMADGSDRWPGRAVGYVVSRWFVVPLLSFAVVALAARLLERRRPPRAPCGPRLIGGDRGRRGWA